MTFNTVLAVTVLKEPLTKSDIAGILLICLSSVSFLCFSQNGDSSLTERQLAKLFLRPVSLVYLLLSFGFIGFVCWLDFTFKKILRNFYEQCSESVIVSNLQIRSMISAISFVDKVTMTRINQGKFTALKNKIKLPMILMSFVAGLLGSLQGSMLKAFTISLSIKGWGAPETLGYLALGGFLAIVQLKSLNIAMEYYD